MSRSPFEGVTNRSDWFGGVYCVDDTTGEPIDLSTSTGTMTLRDADGNERVVANSEDGTLTFPEPGYAVFNIDHTAMKAIPAGAYRLGLLIDTDTTRWQAALTGIRISEGL
jgi:hypothetical protein